MLINCMMQKNKHSNFVESVGENGGVNSRFNAPYSGSKQSSDR